MTDDVPWQSLLSQLNDSHGPVVDEARRFLQTIFRARPDIARAAADRLLDLDAPEARGALADSLAGSAGDDEVRSRLRAALRDPDARVRAAAARSLGSQCEIEAVRDSLLDALNDSDSGVVVAAAQSLRPVRGDPAVAFALAERMGHRTQEVRLVAQRTLFDGLNADELGVGEQSGAGPSRSEPDGVPSAVDQDSVEAFAPARDAVGIVTLQVEEFLIREPALSDIERAFLEDLQERLAQLDDLIGRLGPADEIAWHTRVLSSIGSRLRRVAEEAETQALARSVNAAVELVQGALASAA